MFLARNVASNEKDLAWGETNRRRGQRRVHGQWTYVTRALAGRDEHARMRTLWTLWGIGDEIRVVVPDFEYILTLVNAYGDEDVLEGGCVYFRHFSLVSIKQLRNIVAIDQMNRTRLNLQSYNPNGN